MAVYTRAVIVGTGFSGLGMGIALQEQGVDFVILESADEVGGTWRDNSYPGCACDVVSYLYSFSFEPKATWSRLYSPQAEILDYLKGVTDKHGLRRHIRFNSMVKRAHWDDSEYRWHVLTDTGQEYIAQFLISGGGGLHIPSFPDVDGVDEFRGPAFHSARWDHDVDLVGKRVAVIGTGASAIQIVPSIVDEVAELQLYQRTPPWVLTRVDDLPDGVRRALTTVPGLRRAFRYAIYGFSELGGYALSRRPALLRVAEWSVKRTIRRDVGDPQVRRRLMPAFRFGCKRILFSNNYYRAVDNPKTTLITEEIARLTPDGVVTKDGTQREVDVIVFATGFRVPGSYLAFDMTGKGGVDLVDRWKREGVEAHRGVAVTDMPNLFMLWGPNTALGHTSVVIMIESQIRYVAQAIAIVDKVGAQALAPTGAAQRRYNDELQRRLGRSVWNTGGCRSFYLDEHGVNRTQWSGTTWRYRFATRSLRPSEYQFFGVKTGSPTKWPALTVVD
jgi:cation diffusion facilitator CzcD-associated flavoprotein CzcO